MASMEDFKGYSEGEQASLQNFMGEAMRRSVAGPQDLDPAGSGSQLPGEDGEPDFLLPIIEELDTFDSPDSDATRLN